MAFARRLTVDIDPESFIVLGGVNKVPNGQGNILLQSPLLISLYPHPSTSEVRREIR